MCSGSHDSTHYKTPKKVSKGFRDNECTKRPLPKNLEFPLGTYFNLSLLGLLRESKIKVIYSNYTVKLGICSGTQNGVCSKMINHGLFSLLLKFFG